MGRKATLPITFLPAKGLLEHFNGMIQPITQQLKVLAFSNHQLRTARNLLLPRLMNGEITV